MWLGAQEELAEFNAEEKDVLQSIGALKSAVTVLGKHHSEFLQVRRLFSNGRAAQRS